MDALEFIRERNRMCKSFGDECSGCPAFNVCEDNLCCLESTMDATDQVAIVEKWSAAHPRKTRQSVFLEQYPEAHINKDGYLDICPLDVSAAHRDDYGGCATIRRECEDCRREFWMQEVE